MAFVFQGGEEAIEVSDMKTLFGGQLSEPVVFPQAHVGGKTYAILRAECKHLRNFLGLRGCRKCPNKLGLLLKEMRCAISEASMAKANEMKLVSGGAVSFGRRRFRADIRGHMENLFKVPNEVEVTLEVGGPVALPEEWTFKAMFNARKCDAPTMLFDIDHWEKMLKFARVGTSVGGQVVRVRKGRSAPDPERPPKVAQHSMRLKHGVRMYRARVPGRQGTAMARTRRLCTPAECSFFPKRKNREDVYSRDERLLQRGARSISNWLEGKRDQWKRARSNTGSPRSIFAHTPPGSPFRGSPAEVNE